jgi:hypothetical protein
MNGALLQLGDSAAGRPCARRCSLPAWKPDHRAGKRPEGEWHDLPGGFPKALKTAADFANRQPGALMGVLLDGCHAYATNNTVLVEVETSGDVPSGVIPLALARLLIKRTVSPRAMLASERAVAFAWDDGTWIEFASRHEVSAVVPAKFAKWREPEWQIPASWKKEFRAVARIAEETIIIGPESISAAGGQTEIEAETNSPVSQDTIWCPKILGPVIKLAERIDFTSHSKGACFAFPGGRGFVAGKV